MRYLFAVCGCKSVDSATFVYHHWLVQEHREDVAVVKCEQSADRAPGSLVYALFVCVFLCALHQSTVPEYQIANKLVRLLLKMYHNSECTIASALFADSIVHASLTFICCVCCTVYGSHLPMAHRRQERYRQNRFTEYFMNHWIAI